MEIEKIGNSNSARTPIKRRSSQGAEQTPRPIIIQDDSPVLESVQQIKPYYQKDSRSTVIDEKIEHNFMINQYQEKKLDNNLFSQAERNNFRDFNKHLENIKMYAAASEKENQISQSIMESSKQIQSRSVNRDQHLQEAIQQSKQSDFNFFNNSQNEEFKVRIKQKELIISQKEDENRELATKIKILEQRLSGQELELVDYKQTNKKYQQLLDEQKSVFEKKIQKVQTNQDFTSDINGEWKTQMLEQKQLIEELQRKVTLLDSKLERTEIENQSMAEKNMELSNENFDLKEEVEKQKRDYQLLKAQKRQEEGIFDEYGNQQNKFISSLISYQKDLKDVFDQINNNPIIEKYKKQNDELLIENTSLRDQVIKLNQELSEKQLDEIKKNNQEQDMLSENDDQNTKNNAMMLYDSMMQKFTEMDERMVQNDNEKFEALQQKDYWFGKSQQLEIEVDQLKESIKNLNSKIEDLESQYLNTKNTNKKGNNTNANINKTKKRKAGKESDIEEDSTHITDKKLKPNQETIELSPQVSLQHTVSVHNNKNEVLPEKELPVNPIQQKPVQAPTSGPSLPVKNTALFQLKVCIKCNLNIKKLQEYETCSTCKKDYHSKCKGENVIGSFCHPCYEKQKKKANTEMEVEKSKDTNKQPDMVAEN